MQNYHRVSTISISSLFYSHKAIFENIADVYVLHLKNILWGVGSGFRDRDSLFSPGYPGTHSVHQAGLELQEIYLLLLLESWD